jgi:hypothetical protein
MKTDSYGQLHTSATCRQRLVRQSKFQILEAINPLQGIDPVPIDNAILDTMQV